MKVLIFQIRGPVYCTVTQKGIIGNPLKLQSGGTRLVGCKRLLIYVIFVSLDIKLQS
jgi:hypothetical protein